MISSSSDDLDRPRPEVEDRDPRVDRRHVDPDVDRVAVGLDVGQVDRRPEVVGAQPAARRPGAMYRICSTSRSWLVTTVSGRLVDGRDRDRAREGAAVLRRDEARVQQRREDDRRELERPVVDDEPDGAPGVRRGSPAGHGRGRAAPSSSPRRLGDRPSRRGRVGAGRRRPASPGAAGAVGRGVPRRRRRRVDAAGASGCATAAGVGRGRRPPRRPAGRRAAPRAGRSSARSSCASVGHADDPRPLDDAHLAALLGHDDRDGVRVLGDPEGGPMAGPEPLGQRSSR